jgi:hypothetical protein
MTMFLTAGDGRAWASALMPPKAMNNSDVNAMKVAWYACVSLMVSSRTAPALRQLQAADALPFTS